MAFQFLCPNDHLLEGDESQMGEPMSCPICEIDFIVPIVTPDPTRPETPLASEFDFLGGSDRIKTNPFEPSSERDIRILHIPCPNGHDLETPDDMLDQDVLCPFCGVGYRLRYQDSVEAEQARNDSRMRKEEEIGKKWLFRAVLTAFFVIGGLILMVLLTVQR